MADPLSDRSEWTILVCPACGDTEPMLRGASAQWALAEVDRLRAENEALSRDYGTLDRLVQDIERYALTPEPVLRSIEQARRAIADRAAVETDEQEATG